MRWRTWRLFIATILGTSFCLTGCNRHQAAPPPQPLEVAVVTVQPQQVVLTSQLPGRTASYLVAEIRPQVNGLLQKRLFVEGAHVKQGDVLYEIDPAPYQAEYDRAVATHTSMQQTAERARATLEASIADLKRHEANLKLAITNRERFESLVKRKAASAMDYDKAVADAEAADATLQAAKAQVESNRQAVEEAVAGIKQAEAAMEVARINLGYTKITAPITGRIGRSHVTEGAIVTAYQPVPLATIQQFDPIYVDVPQSTAELNRLRRSLANGRLKDNGTDKVKIVLEDGQVLSQEGSLQFRDVTVDPTTGSIILRIVVPNPDGTLLPGMFVQAIIEEGVRDQAILVLQQAVSRGPKGDPYTLIVDKEGKVQQRGITTERALGDKWLVSSGLSQGDRVIVEGIQQAARARGAPVKAVPFEDSGAVAKAEGSLTATAKGAAQATASSNRQ